jgi:hypothetical protein
MFILTTHALERQIAQAERLYNIASKLSSNATVITSSGAQFAICNGLVKTVLPKHTQCKARRMRLDERHSVNYEHEQHSASL